MSENEPASFDSHDAMKAEKSLNKLDPMEEGTALFSLPDPPVAELPLTDIKTELHPSLHNSARNHPSENSPFFETVYTNEHSTNADSSPVRPSNRFEVLSEHARGGLGVVFLAVDTEFGREVALKQIRPDRSNSVEYQFKFAREAKLTGQLEHPCIVPVYASGRDSSGTPFYAMRFIRGKDLLSRIQEFHASVKGKSIPYDSPELRALLRRFSDVLNAIAYAHSKGVLHRDLKPSNVMLGEHGETLVVDWGLAKQIGETSSLYEPSVTRPQSNELENVGLLSPTNDGSFLGSPAYAAPEQALGQISQVGTCSDIYSLGAMLFHLLTGETPVSGKSLGEILLKITEGRIPSPESIVPSIPGRLALICIKAMSRDPNDRFHSATEMKNEIELWLDDQPSSLFPEPWLSKFARWVRNHPAITASVAVTLSLALLASVIVLQVSGAYQSQLSAKVRQITEASRQLEASNETITAQAKEFRITTAKRDLEMGRQAYVSGQNRTAVSSLQNAIDLSSEVPDLRRKILKETWGLISDFQRSSITFHQSISASTQGEFSVSATSLVSFGSQSKQLWNLNANAPQDDFYGAPVANQRIRFSTNGVIAASQSRLDHTIQVRRLTTPDSLIGLPIQESGEVELFVSNSGGTVVCRPTSYEDRFLSDPTEGNMPIKVSSTELLSIWKRDESGSWTHSLLCPRLFSKQVEETRGHISSVFVNEQGTRMGVLFDLPGEQNRETTFQLWDVANVVSPIATIRLSNALFSQADLCPDESRILIQDADVVRILDTQTGEQIHSLQHDSEVTRCSSNADSNLIATYSMDHILHLWNGNSGESLYEMAMEDLMDIRYSRNGLYFAIAKSKGTIEIYDGNDISWPLSGKLNHGNDVSRITFTPDSETLLSFDEGSCMRCWNISHNVTPPTINIFSRYKIETEGYGIVTPPFPLNVPPTPPFPVAPLPTLPPSPEGSPPHPSMLEAPPTPIPSTPTRPSAIVPPILETPSSEFPFASPSPGLITVPSDVSAPNPSFEEFFPIHDPENWTGTQFHPNPNKRFVYYYSREYGFNVIDQEHFGLLPKHGELDNIRRFSISPNGAYLGCYNADGHNQLRLLDDFTLVSDKLFSQSPCTDMCFSVDSRFVAMAFLDGTAVVQDCETKSLAAPNLTHNAAVIAQAFSPDTNLYATITSRGTLQFFDMKSFEVLKTIQLDRNTVGKLTFMADGKSIVCSPAESDHYREAAPIVTILDVEKGEIVKTIRLSSASTGRIQLALHPASGRIAYRAENTESIQFYDVNKHLTSELIFPSSEDANVESHTVKLEFSSDGCFLVVILNDGHLIIIETMDAVIVQKRLLHPIGAVTQIACHPHENTFCFHSGSTIILKSLNLYPVPSDTYITHCLSLLSHRNDIRGSGRVVDRHLQQETISLREKDWSDEIRRYNVSESVQSHFDHASDWLDKELPEGAQLHINCIHALKKGLEQPHSQRLLGLERQIQIMSEEIQTSESMLDGIIQGDEAVMETVESMLSSFALHPTNQRLSYHRQIVFETWLLRASTDQRKKIAEKLRSISNQSAWISKRRHLLLVSEILAGQAKEPYDNHRIFSYYAQFYNVFYWISQGKYDLARQCLEESSKEITRYPNLFQDSFLNSHSIELKFDKVRKQILDKLARRIKQLEKGKSQ